MDEDKYLDRFGNPLVGDKLYKSTDNEYLIPYSRASNNGFGWFATSFGKNSQTSISIDDAKKLKPVLKEDFIKALEGKRQFAESHLEKITDHENIPSVFEQMCQVKDDPGYEKQIQKYFRNNK